MTTPTAAGEKKCGRPVVWWWGNRISPQKDYIAATFNIYDVSVVAEAVREAKIILVNTFRRSKNAQRSTTPKNIQIHAPLGYYPNQAWEINSFVALTNSSRAQFNLKDEGMKRRMGKLQQQLIRLPSRVLNTPPHYRIYTDGRYLCSWFGLYGPKDLTAICGQHIQRWAIVADVTIGRVCSLEIWLGRPYI